jgi:hypothetical protein
MKYKIKQILNGKPFEIPAWTVEKHEKHMEEMIPYEDKLEEKTITQKEYDRTYRFKMILISLKEVDPTLTENKLRQIHPDNLVDLWIACYNSGKEDIVVNESDFREGEQSPLKA